MFFSTVSIWSSFLQPDAHTCEFHSWGVRHVSGQGNVTMRKWCIVWITTPFSACFAGHCIRGEGEIWYVIPRLLSNMYLFYRLIERLSSLSQPAGYWLPAEGLWDEVLGGPRVPPHLWWARLLPGGAVLREGVLVCQPSEWRSYPWIHAQWTGQLQHCSRIW